MTIAELSELMDKWLARSISSAEKESLRLYYLEINNFDRYTCTTCPDFWNDVQTGLRIVLKQNGITTMKVEPKYTFAPNVGNIRFFGSGKTYVIEGPESDTNILITDEVGDQLLADHPELSEQLILNPEYNKDASRKPQEKVAGATVEENKEEEPKKAKTPAKVKKEPEEKTGEAPKPKTRLSAKAKKAMEDAELAAKGTQPEPEPSKTVVVSNPQGEGANIPPVAPADGSTQTV